MNKLVEQARSWLGFNEMDGSHKRIIDTYNAHKPLSRGYKVTYDDAWCATFVSACVIEAGLTDLIPLECGCQEMIRKMKEKGIWVENDAHVPSPGDIIFYDWQDDGRGDNVGYADHVGIVEACDGQIITVIEGNRNDSVSRRSIYVDGKSIRGYGVPKYPTTAPTTPTDTQTDTTEKRIWTFLLSWLKNPYGVAGLMGNLYAESALNPKNLQQTFEKKLGLTDQEYTDQVDNGTYHDFIYDKAGYGLAQWTYWSRKRNLLGFCRSQSASVGDLDAQLNFLMVEMIQNYPTLVETLKTYQSVQECSDAVLIKYEQPSDQSDAVKARRAEYGHKYYDKYATEITTKDERTTVGADYLDKDLKGTYITITDLYMRDKPGKDGNVMVTLRKDQEVRCYGYFSINVDGVRWLYVQTVVKGIRYTGFCSSRYLSLVET